jgi:hypothetical protein
MFHTYCLLCICISILFTGVYSQQSCSDYTDCQYTGCSSINSNHYGCNCINYWYWGNIVTVGYNYVDSLDCNYCYYSGGTAKPKYACQKKCPSTCNNGSYIKNPNTPTCECVPCIAGSFCLDGSMQTCGKKMYSNAGSSNCIPCVNIIENSTLQDIASNSSNCPVICNSGLYLDNNVCKECPDNHWCKENIKYPCPLNSFSAKLSSSKNSCICQTGYKQCSGNCTWCERCAAGSYTNVTNASACHDCPIGTFEVNATSCVPCPVNTFNNIPGQSSCSNCSTCSPGAYQIQACMVLADTICKECPRDTYNMIYGSTTCEQCPENSYCSRTSVLPCVNNTCKRCSSCNIGK